MFFPFLQSKNQVHRRGEYNVYSTFQSHEPEFDYLKSLEIEEKINKIRWLPQQNAAYFLLSTNGMWRWLTLFGVFRDIVSKPYISISLSLHFPFYLEPIPFHLCQHISASNPSISGAQSSLDVPMKLLFSINHLHAGMNCKQSSTCWYELQAVIYMLVWIASSHLHASMNCKQSSTR